MSFGSTPSRVSDGLQLCVFGSADLSVLEGGVRESYDERLVG